MTAVRLGVLVAVAGIVLISPARGGRQRAGEDATGDHGVKAVRDFLEKAKGLVEDRELQASLLRVVDDDGKTSNARWEGSHGVNVFVILSKPMPRSPDGARTGPAAIKMVSIIAFNELLKTSTAVKKFAELGLDDSVTLKKAIARAGLTGVLKGVRHEEAVSGDFAVGYAVVDAGQVETAALDKANTSAVERAYLQCTHEKVTALIEARKTDEALALCRGLRAKRLASGDLLLATAQCLHAMGKTKDAVECIRGDLPVFVERSSASFLQRVGDTALQYGANDLARDAYRAATQKMLQPDVVQ